MSKMSFESVGRMLLRKMPNVIIFLGFGLKFFNQKFVDLWIKFVFPFCLVFFILKNVENIKKNVVAVPVGNCQILFLYTNPEVIFGRYHLSNCPKNEFLFNITLLHLSYGENQVLCNSMFGRI